MLSTIWNQLNMSYPPKKNWLFEQSFRLQLHMNSRPESAASPELALLRPSPEKWAVGGPSDHQGVCCGFMGLVRPVPTKKWPMAARRSLPVSIAIHKEKQKVTFSGTALRRYLVKIKVVNSYAPKIQHATLSRSRFCCWMWPPKKKVTPWIEVKIQPRFGLITKMQRCDNSLRRHRDSAHLQHVLHLCHVGFQPVPLSSGVTKQGSEINHMEVSEDVNELGKCPLPCLITGYHLVN